MLSRPVALVVVSAAALLLVALLLWNASAGSAGGNVIASSDAGGQIVFTSDRDGNNEIYVMNADGSGQTRLTNNVAADTQPAWSPDGSRIVFTSNRDGNGEIYVMNADGSGQTRLTNNAADDSQPTWSPDGSHIAFASVRTPVGIYIMNADGSDPFWLTFGFRPDWSPDGSRIAYEMTTVITPTKTREYIYVAAVNGSGVVRLTFRVEGDPSDWSPSWSPDGTRIAFLRFGSPVVSGIYVMNADGSGQTFLAANIFPFGHTWSPDGSRIAFASGRDGNSETGDFNTEIYVMNADGSDQTRITNNPARDSDPDWLSLGPTGPLVINPPSSSSIEVDGQFGPPSAEWLDITPLLFLDGASIVYTGLDSDASAIYLMYDLSISTVPLEIGESGGPVTFEGVCDGVFGVFSVFITQGGANTEFGPGHASISEGGIGDTVDVSFNDEPAPPGSLCNPIIDTDEGEACIEGAVDYNSTSPDFPFPHNLFELEICLLTTPDTPGGFSNGVYSPDPSFWGADLPTDGGTIVSESIVDIKTVDDVTGVTEVIPLMPVVTPSPTPSPTPAPATFVWGDHNCSGSAGPVDSLLTLRFDAGLSTNTGDCPDLGQIVDVQNASPHPWGDVDCGGEVTPVDSLKLLRFDAGLSVSQADDCPEIGASVTIREG